MSRTTDHISFEYFPPKTEAGVHKLLSETVPALAASELVVDDVGVDGEPGRYAEDSGDKTRAVRFTSGLVSEFVRWDTHSA